METENFEKVYAAILADIAIGAHLQDHLIGLHAAIEDLNRKIDSATNKPSENTGSHVLKSRLIYLAYEITLKLKENGTTF